MALHSLTTAGHKADLTSESKAPWRIARALRLDTTDLSSHSGSPGVTKNPLPVLHQEELRISGSNRLDKASAAIEQAARSDTARDLASKAKATAEQLARKVKDGAPGAAEAFAEANRDSRSITVGFINAGLTALSPSEGSALAARMQPHSRSQMETAAAWSSMPPLNRHSSRLWSAPLPNWAATPSISPPRTASTSLSPNSARPNAAERDQPMR